MDKLEAWLTSIGLGQYAAVCASNDITLELVNELTEHDLVQLGMSLGHRRRFLVEVASREPRQGIQVALPSVEALTDPTRRPRLNPQRRFITVMFCDLIGSTALSLRYDPEDLRSIISAYHHCCTRVIKDRYNGFMARFMGDGILAYFGFPLVDEFNAEHAVRAAVELVAEVGALQVFADLRLQVRVGIATGEVIVSEIDPDGNAREQAAFGPTPNLAARLERLAQPNAVVIAESTRQLLGDLFQLTNIGLHTLDGFDRPQRAWLVGAEQLLDNRFEATHPPAQRTPLVGRDEELDALTQLWVAAKAGRGAVVLLEGEPGIGKSRLAQALHERIEKDPLIMLRYFGAPYTQNSMLAPIIAQFLRAAAIEPSDDDTARLAKIESVLRLSSDDVATALPLIAELLSVPPGSRFPLPNLSPMLHKENTLRVLLQQMLGLSRVRPVLVMSDDLHWMDPTTQELLGQLIPVVATHPILMVMTTRPGFQAAWLTLPHVTRVPLGRLSRDESRQLVTQLAVGSALPSDVVEMILAKTDGVPLFLEEFTRNVVESGSVAGGDTEETSHGKTTLPVPATLHLSLMARLDRLGEAKTVAQIASALGGDFSLDLLEQVVASCRLEDDIDTDQLDAPLAIERLIEARIIESRELAHTTTFWFRHALVQDEAYRSLLRTARENLHRVIATVYERHHPHACEASPELIAHHLTSAGELDRALDYWQRAGDRAAAGDAHAEAQQHLQQGLKLIARSDPGPERDRRECALQMSLGYSLSMSRGYTAPEVEQAYSQARLLSHRSSEPDRSFPALRNLCTFYMVRAMLETARELAEDCVSLADRTRQPHHLIESRTALGYVLFYSGDLRRARALLQEGVECYAANDGATLTFDTPQDPGVACHSLLAVLDWMSGAPDTGACHMQHAVRLAERLDQPFTLAFVHGYAAVFHQRIGEPARAAIHAEQALAISTHHRYFVWQQVGEIHLWLARHALERADPAIERIHQALAIYRGVGAEIFRPYFDYSLAEALVEADRATEALTVIEASLQHAACYGEHFFDAALYRLRGELRASALQIEAAEQDYLRALELAQLNDQRIVALQAAVELHRLCQHHERPTATLAWLREVCAQFGEDIMSPHLTVARSLLKQAG